MKVTITERHCEVLRRVQARVERRVRAIAKFGQRAACAEVRDTDAKHTRKVKVVVSVDGQLSVAVPGDGEDLRKALTEGFGSVEWILKDQLEKPVDHQTPPLSEALGVV